MELQLEQEGGVARLTLAATDDSETALGPDDARALLRLLDSLTHAGASRALVLESAGPDFCAGHRSGPTPRFADERSALTSEPYRSLVLTLAYLDMPTVASVHGRALGVGLGLALACDVVLASEQARLGRAFGTLGQLLGAQGKATLVKRPGLSEALDALGDRRRLLSARDAERRGIVNDVVPSTELSQTTLATAAVLASGPVESWRAVRALARLVDARIQPELARRALPAQAVHAGPDAAWGLEPVAVPARTRRRRTGRTARRGT